MRQYIFTRPGHVELQERTASVDAFSVGGPTLFTLISAGTEINGPYRNTQGWNYPMGCGYTAVFRAEEIGEKVETIHRGDILFAEGPHSDYQVHRAEHTVRVPDGVRPQSALFARMAGVSMATLSRMRVHPGDTVLVTGLGAVGLMAMQAYSRCGFRVTGVDPAEDRVKAAKELTGLPVYTELPGNRKDFFGLGLECSGTQQGTRTCCEAVREGGEISLVGVPWKQTGDVQSYEILNRIFYKYLTVYSGWEMNLPIAPGRFAPDSHTGNYERALSWMRQGWIHTDGLWKAESYRNLQEIYDRLASGKTDSVSVVLDWENPAGS